MWEAPSTAPPLIHRRMSLLHNPPSPLPVVSGIKQRSTSAQNYVQKKRIAQCTLTIEELQESVPFVTTRAFTFSDPYHQTNGNMRMKTNQFGTFDNTSDSQTALRTSNAPFQCLQNSDFDYNYYCCRDFSPLEHQETISGVCKFVLVNIYEAHV